MSSPAQGTPLVSFPITRAIRSPLLLGSFVWPALRFPLLIALALTSQVVLAAEPSSRCARLRDDGVRLYESGDSKLALPKLEEAQRCHSTARGLLYMGLSQRELGRLDDALVSLKRARDQSGSDSEISGLAEQGIKDVEALKQRPASPPPPISEAAPPPVWKGDRERSRRIERTAAWSLLGAGLLGVVAGAVLVGVDGIPACTKEPRDIRCPQVINTWQGGAVLLSIGGGALVASTVLFVRSRPPAQAEVALHLAPDGASQLSFEF